MTRTATSIQIDRLAFQKKISGNSIPLPTPFHADFILDLPRLA